MDRGDRSTVRGSTPEGPPVPCPWCDAPGQTGPYCSGCGLAMPPRLPDGSLAPVRARRPSRLSRWKTAILSVIAIGMLLCVAILLVGSVPSFDALALSVIAATIPAVVIGWIVIRLDRYEPEPATALAAAFLWGAIGAILLSIIGSLFLSAVAPDLSGPVVVAPLVEESFKGIALVAMTYLYRRELDTTLDGLIYGALIGLGFAFTENILYFGQAYMADGLIGLGALFIARAVFGGFGHAIYTGVIGAAIGWARGQYFRGIMRFVVPFLGWCVAVLLHATWNAGAIGVWTLVDGNDNFFVGIASIALVTIVPGLILLAVVARLSHRRELDILRTQLAPEIENGTITSVEYAAITDDRARRIRLREVKQAGGRSLRRQQQRFFDTAAELAYRKHHIERGERLTPGQTAPEPVFREQLASLRAGLPS